LVTDPKKRWTLAQVREHSWWKKDGPYASNIEVELPPATIPDSTSAAIGGGAGGANDDAMSVGSDNGADAAVGGVNSPKAADAMEISNSTTAATTATTAAAANGKTATTGAAAAVGDIEDDDAGSGPDDIEGGKRINAFDLINMCSGSAIGRMFQSDAEKAVHKTTILVSGKSPQEVVAVLESHLKTITGFQSMNVTRENSKARAVFDLGKGHVHLKIAIKIASDTPRLCVVIFKRGRGDLISFGAIYSHLASLQL